MIIFSILIWINGISLNAEIADTDETRRLGLGGRAGIGEEGMLFIFSSPQKVSFWMRGVTFPIDIGFFNEEGILFQVEEMTPSPPPYRSYRSQGDVQYALEVAPGWFRRHEIEIGAKISLPDGQKEL